MSELEISSETVEAWPGLAPVHAPDAANLEIDANEILPMVGTADAALKLATALKEASIGLRAPARARVRPLLAVRFVRHDDVSKNDAGYQPLSALLHAWGRAQRAREGLTMSARISALTRPWVADGGAVNSGSMWMTEADRECWMRDKHDPKTMCLKRVLGLPDPDEGVLLGYVPVAAHQASCASLPTLTVSALAAEGDLAGLKDPSPEPVILTDAPSMQQAERLCAADVSKLLAATPPARLDNIGDVEAWMLEHDVRVTAAADVEPLVAALRDRVAGSLADLERAKALAAKTPEPKGPATPATSRGGPQDDAATFERLSQWVQDLLDTKPAKPAKPAKPETGDKPSKPSNKRSDDAAAPIGGSPSQASRTDAEPVSDVMDLYRSPGAVGDTRVVQQRGSRRWYRLGSDRAWHLELRPTAWDEGRAAQGFAEEARAASEGAAGALAAAGGGLVAALKASGAQRARYALPQFRAAGTATVRPVLRAQGAQDEPDQREIDDYLSYVDWSTTGDGSKPRPVDEARTSQDEPAKNDRTLVTERVAQALGVELTSRGAAYVSDNLHYYNDDTALTAAVTAQSRRMLAAQAALETQANWQKLSAEAKAATREKTRQRVAQTKEAMTQQHYEKSACVAAALLALLALLGFTEHARLADEVEPQWARGSSDAVQAQLATVLRASTLSSGEDVKGAWTDILADKSELRARWEERPGRKHAPKPPAEAPSLTTVVPATAAAAAAAASPPTAPTLLVVRVQAEAAAADGKQQQPAALRFASAATVRPMAATPSAPETDATADKADEAAKDVVVLLSQLGSNRAKQWGEVLAQASRTTVARFVHRDVLGMITSIAWGARPTASRVAEAINRLRDEKLKRALVERCRSVLKDHLSGSLDWRRGIVQLLGDVKLDATPQIRDVKVQLGNHFVDGLLQRHNIESVDAEDLQHSKEAARQLRDHATILKQEAMDAEVRAALGVLKKEGYAGWRQEIDDLTLEDADAVGSVLEADAHADADAGPADALPDEDGEADADADRGADASAAF